MTHKHSIHRRPHFSAVKISSSLCAENANFICSFDLWTLVFLRAVVFPLKFLTAPRQSGLSEVSNTFSFALIWLKSDECVMGRLRNAVWNCTWGSGFSGRKEIYEEVLGDGGGVTLSFLRFSLNPSHKLQDVCNFTMMCLEDTWKFLTNLTKECQLLHNTRLLKTKQVTRLMFY